MSKRYSIAEARKRLAALIDEAESGVEVRLTRRGEPVVVVLSVREYERLKEERVAFGEAYGIFRREFPEGKTGVPAQYFRSLKDRSPGRKVKL